MTDVVFFAGPVLIKQAFRQIDWYGRDVRIIPIAGAGSSHFSNLAEQLRDSSGRILPNLLARYAKGISVDKIAMAAYSAGHGLLNKVADVDADRVNLSAMVLSDATFNAFNTGPKAGYVKMGLDAAHGDALFVSTTANTSDGSHMTGRDSWELVWREVHLQGGGREREVGPREPAPQASGGWHRMGSLLYWGDYYSPAGSDLTHGQHHDVAPLIWQAYLAPYLAGKLTSVWPWALAGILGGTGSVLLWKGLKSKGYL